MQTIRIACTGAATLPIEQIVPMQGSLKSMTPTAHAKLRNEILTMGFSCPFHIWRNGDRHALLDGHQRLVVLLQLRADGFDVPALPVVWVDAIDEHEARHKLLAMASVYGHMTPQSLHDYLTDAGIEFDAAMASFDFPAIDVDELSDLFEIDANGVQGLDQSIYTRKVESPIYEPRGEQPAVSALCDTEKTDRLVAEIKAAALPDDIKGFLLRAAQRHIVFAYDKIADYYAHAPQDVQALMEKSALVIIDFEKAIENGFVVLTREIAEACPYDAE